MKSMFYISALIFIDALAYISLCSEEPTSSTSFLDSNNSRTRGEVESVKLDDIEGEGFASATRRRRSRVGGVEMDGDDGVSGVAQQINYMTSLAESVKMDRHNISYFIQNFATWIFAFVANEIYMKNHFYRVLCILGIANQFLGTYWARSRLTTSFDKLKAVINQKNGGLDESATAKRAHAIINMPYSNIGSFRNTMSFRDLFTYFSLFAVTSFIFLLVSKGSTLYIVSMILSILMVIFLAVVKVLSGLKTFGGNNQMSDIKKENSFKIRHQDDLTDDEREVQSKSSSLVISYGTIIGTIISIVGGGLISALVEGHPYGVTATLTTLGLMQFCHSNFALQTKHNLQTSVMENIYYIIQWIVLVIMGAYVLARNQSMMWNSSK